MAATNSASSTTSVNQSSKILLATALVLIEDNCGLKYPARALLDSGSESNFVSERLCQRMRISRTKVDVSIVGIGGVATSVEHKVHATIRSRTSPYAQKMSFLVLPRVTLNLPTATVQTKGWNMPDGIELADPAFYQSGSVDLVLGIKSFFSFFQTGNEISLGDSLPRLTESVFGWVVSGEMASEEPISRISCNMAISDRLEELITRFWSCEEVGTTNYSPEESCCEESFQRTVQRSADGRYTVTLPKNEDIISKLGKSMEIAKKRFESVERRLTRNDILREQYQRFMKEYIEMGHMRKVEEDQSNQLKRCYLPHHAILKESSTTTKLRIVFDASCKTSNGISLNDALFVGPVIQRDLRAILLRCRTYQVMIVADIEKMFRQINIDPKDAPLQSILWRADENENLATYELSTVTYGTKPAPFLATRTLKQLASDERERYPLAAKAVEEDMYIDDLITGTDDVNTAIELRRQCEQMMSSGGFTLRKWASNVTAVLEGVAQESLASPEIHEISWELDQAVQSLPRLELCGAVLAVELMEKVKEAVRAHKIFFWTDSTCVLQWIKATPTTWVTFVANRVANRVAKIQNFRGKWNHVPGTSNLADLISRGVAPDVIGKCSLWWEGPCWLKEVEENWPCQPTVVDEDPSEVRRKVAACLTAVEPEFDIWYISKFSSYTKMIRTTAYWVRLIELQRNPKSDHNFGFLTSSELKGAEMILFRLVQRLAFNQEIRALSNSKPVPRNSSLRWFNPFIMEDGILRVGGRLSQSQERAETKHQIVLPAKHPITTMIFVYHHEKLLHAGPQLLLSAVRLRFWPLGGRNIAKRVVHQCQRCFRAKPILIQQQMGQLPRERVTVGRAFLKSGVDYFGPVYIRDGRRKPARKTYVALFVCMSTKAVHMEHVTDLSTERFLQALRRFISRRGRCTDIFSDNGTNFVGAKNKMCELFDLLKDQRHHDAISKECANEGMQWHFIPPAAPHFGGLWEAAVRSAKFHLLRVLGENPVCQEDFSTLLVQVEASLNSRPLTPMSDDPTDLETLTPAHFLTGDSLQNIPEPDYSTVQLNRLSRWQLVQRQL
ncbi:uncharacterized protein LOC129773511 [Toxorhynchites rutilus septentrionalis]|uniref:uncharacterized protein LOC129773511 n=1 Tax=Toxorhynchites rutilus septentrionalis TaxID=329112 RepID=UPI002479BB9F|nr:uncharacterized protein LOC129773511 [Toxorhynchites rutilus septentrionalis]